MDRVKTSKALFAAAAMGALASCGGASTPVGSTAATPAGAASTVTPGSRPRDLDTYMALIDLDVYKSKVAPAFDKYVNTGDDKAVRALLASASLPELGDKKKRLEAAIKLAPAVVEAKCLVKLPGIEPYQLGGGELVSYLYSASDWLRETLTSKDISDETLDYPLGEHAEIIRPADATEIRVYARKVPAPEDANVGKQLAALLTMMDAVSRSPHYALALVMR